MGLKEKVIDMKSEIEDLQEQSLAMELLKDYKKANKRMFVLILVILGMWFATIGYLVYVLNDIGYVETDETIDIQEVEQINDSTIKIGDDIWEKSQ